MEAWVTTFRKGIAPLLSTEGLTALLKGLREDDPHIIQGATCNPPPVACVSDWPVEGADAIAYAYWHGDRGGECTVGEAEEFFARVCFDCDTAMGEPAACRWFLNAHDDTPRAVFFPQLEREVANEIARRMAAEDGLPPFETGTPAGIIADYAEEKHNSDPTWTQRVAIYRQLENRP